MQPEKNVLRLLTENIARAERSVVDGRQRVQRTLKRVQESLFILQISREIREGDGRAMKVGEVPVIGVFHSETLALGFAAQLVP